ncbi:MAG: TrmH family RNA methyltransferase [Bdellovibrionaceae bacterium]|nr:TrmH family RNA methyltransferase [Pseudobdellovibrionaceae bacterium]
MKDLTITSAQNRWFKTFKDITRPQGIKKHGLFLLSGENLVKEFLSEKLFFEIVGEILTEGLKPLTDGKYFNLNKVLFNEIDTIGTKFNILLIKAPEIPHWNENSQPQGVEVLCPLGDPVNLGAVARSALAFGATKLILTDEACHPFPPRAIKASSLALLKIPLFKAPGLAALSPSAALWALDRGGEDISRFSWPENLRLLVGEEGPGVPAHLRKQRISIPIANVESLNAAVAGGIALWTRSLTKSRR